MKGRNFQNNENILNIKKNKNSNLSPKKLNLDERLENLTELSVKEIMKKLSEMKIIHDIKEKGRDIFIHGLVILLNNPKIKIVDKFI